MKTVHAVPRRRLRKIKNRRVVAKAASESRRDWLAVGKRVFSGVLLLSSLSGATLGLGYGWQALQSCERLQLHNIEVAGVLRTTRDELVAYAGLELGAPMFGLELDDIAARIRENPWVQSATVRRILPDGVRIDVVEHQPVILVALGQVYLVNSDGYVFKRLAADDRVTLPVVTGLSRDEAIGAPDALATQLREAVALYQQVRAQESVLGRIDELSFRSALGWDVVTRDGTRLELGSEPAVRMATAVQAIERLEALGKQAKVVRVSGERMSRRVYVEPQRTRLSSNSSTSNQETILARVR